MDVKLRACQAHKKESSGHTAIIFNNCLQALQYVLREDKNASEIFLFYNKVSDLLTPLIKSGGNGELSNHHQGYLHLQSFSRDAHQGFQIDSRGRAPGNHVLTLC